MLDLTLLQNIRQRGDKWIAKCPACAEVGGDSKGEHLIIYPDNRFGCVANGDDQDHRRDIFRLVGVKPKANCKGKTSITPEIVLPKLPIRVPRYERVGCIGYSRILRIVPLQSVRRDERKEDLDPEANRLLDEHPKHQAREHTMGIPGGLPVGQPLDMSAAYTTIGATH